VGGPVDRATGFGIAVLLFCCLAALLFCCFAALMFWGFELIDTGAFEFFGYIYLD